MTELNRRRFLHLAAAGLLTPYMLRFAGGHIADAREGAANVPLPGTRALAQDPGAVFPLSVASGDPSPSGVVLWTRLAPDAWRPDHELVFQVAKDPGFARVVLEGEVDGHDCGPERGHTVKIDLDGHLAANRVYFYRFLWDGTASRTGRCRTLPEPDDEIDRVRFGVITCQDYTNGYYPAFFHLALEPIDFVVHLGDFIYESVNDPRFQSPYPGREIPLPSGGTVAVDLEDYRAIYRTYRSDPFLQLAMERHTWIVVWDDHEMANDCYWDAATDAPGAPDHPFKDDPERLRQLFRDSRRAWWEYVPARPQIEPDGDLQDYLPIYRGFRFGNLAELFMADDRTYRSPHPCGEEDGERYLTPPCDARHDPERTMLGPQQRTWLVDGMKNSDALWKVWGNQVFNGALRLTRRRPEEATFHVTLDAWDGYEYERRQIMAALQGVKNFVTLTGDLHTYLASYMLVDYDTREIGREENLVGVEFMTPAVTSATILEIIEGTVAADSAQEKALSRLSPSDLVEVVVRLNNPHIVFFNAEHNGYAIVQFDRRFCRYTAYAVDKTDDRGYGGEAALVQKSGMRGNRLYLPSVAAAYAAKTERVERASRPDGAGEEPAGRMGLTGKTVVRRLRVPVNRVRILPG